MYLIDVCPFACFCLFVCSVFFFNSTYTYFDRLKTSYLELPFSIFNHKIRICVTELTPHFAFKLSSMNQQLQMNNFVDSHFTECQIENCETCFGQSFCTRCREPFLSYRGQCIDRCPEGMHYANYSKDCRPTGRFIY